VLFSGSTPAVSGGEMKSIAVTPGEYLVSHVVNGKPLVPLTSASNMDQMVGQTPALAWSTVSVSDIDASLKDKRVKEGKERRFIWRIVVNAEGWRSSRRSGGATSNALSSLTRAAVHPGHRPQPAHTGLGSDLTVGQAAPVSSITTHLTDPGGMVGRVGLVG